MSITQTEPSEIMQADVVVAGGGGGGMAAAVAAAELGASVIVLEKRRRIGGNAVFAEGFFAAESPAQERNNIYAGRDECFRIAMDYSHWTIDARIIRAFIDKSGDTVRWLEAKGLDCNWIVPLYPGQEPLVWHCFKGRGAAVIDTLNYCCQESGVKIIYEATARDLMTDTSGKITGILAETPAGNLHVNTGQVIIATGGFGGNREMLKQYAPLYHENMSCAGLPNEGEGIRMALAAGAASDGLGNLHLIGPSFHGPDRLATVATEPTTIWINQRGHRFTDESTAYDIFQSANTLFRQPDRICYSLFDENASHRILQDGLIKGSGIIIVPPRYRYPELDDDLKRQVARDRVKIADSWSEIAGWIGCEPAVLEAEIAEYNSACDQGHDALFTKDRRFLTPLRTPPFYAMKCGINFLGTIGGIKINSRMEVLDHDGIPIPGLYAAGVDTGGWESEHYCAALSGTTFGFALNSGRIAAENAVKSLHTL
jgi:fumarate reductase flavoprotein subunit